MQNEANVYAAPKAQLTGAGVSGEVSAGILEKLRKTRPWVLLIAVLLLIGAVFMVLAAAGMLLVGSFGGPETGFPLGMGIGMGVIYLIGAVIYLFLGIYLLKYSGAIKRSGSSGSSADVEDAIGHQQAFWRLTGILALIGVVITLIMVLIGIVGGIAGSMMTQ